MNILLTFFSDVCKPNSAENRPSDFFLCANGKSNFKLNLKPVLVLVYLSSILCCNSHNKHIQ